MKLKNIIKEIDKDKHIFIWFFTIMISLIIFDLSEIHIPAISIFIVLFSFCVSYVIIKSVMKILMEKYND